MKLYHGSTMVIESVDLSRSRRGKDFGRGFYLSDNYEQAFNMACLTTERAESGGPIVTEFEIDENVFSGDSLNVKCFDDYTEEWAQFVLDNRKNNKGDNIHDYDIVIGPIANDKVGVQIRRYMLGDIDVKQLVDELRFYKGMTIQYFFASMKAVDLLKKV